jgi:hypothetical protein
MVNGAEVVGDPGLSPVAEEEQMHVVHLAPA